MTLFLIVTCIICAWVLLAQIGAERARDLAQLQREYAKQAADHAKK
jgi:hypothetical protein